jgi:hypothetical protein
MNPDDLARILDELGQRLGPTGEYVFALAVRQVYIDAFLGLLVSIPVLIGVTLGTLWGIRASRRAWAADVKAYAEGKSRWSLIRNQPDLVDYAFPWLFGGMAIVVVGGVAGTLFAASLADLLNPEYAALRDIVGAIR